jgi:uncharacterized membrane protein
VATVNESVEVDVPVTTAYNQWTQFENFPQFMEGVEAVRQLDETRLLWVAELGGERREWEAKILDQEPDRRIEWRADDADGPRGIVMFEPAGAERTRITVEFEWDPEGVKESLGATVGLDARRVKGDLKRFKELIEGRGFETGAWRGEIHEGDRTRR